jgi:zinc protease
MRMLRRSRPSLTTWFALSVAAALPAGAQRIALRDTVLANGLTVIVAENHAIPLATAEVVVRTGAFMQEPGEEGIAHLYEHLLFRAYGPDQRFGLEVADLKGYYNGSTSDEQVNYYVTAPSKEVSSMVRMLARLVISPAFRDEDLEAERRIVKAEFERDASESDFALRTETGRRLWGADWTRKDALGNPGSIDRIPMAKVRSIYSRDYVPSNAAIVVTGDVRAADVFAQAARRFADWKAGASAATAADRPLPAALATSQVFAVSSPHQRLVNLTFTWQGPSVRASGPEAGDARAAALFAEMANSGVSPMIDRLVNSGAVQSAEMEYVPRNLRGTVSLSFVILPAAVERAIPLIRTELGRFDSSDYLNEELIGTSIKARMVDNEFRFERSSTMAHSVGSAWARSGNSLYRSSFEPANPTSADVAKFVKSTLTGHTFVIGALTSIADVERVRRALTAAFASDGVR